MRSLKLNLVTKEVSDRGGVNGLYGGGVDRNANEVMRLDTLLDR